MTGKRITAVVAIVMAIALLSGCGESRTNAPAPADKVQLVTVPAAVEKPLVTEAPAASEEPAVNNAGMRKYRTFGYNYCIHKDGTVSFRDDDGYYTQMQDRNWTDIVAVVENYPGYVGLRADGTVVTTKLDNHEAQVLSGWNNIVDIQAHSGYGSTVGLRADGKVLYAGGESVMTQWKGIVQLASGYYGVFGLKEDGSVVSEDPRIDLSSWTDVVQLAVGANFVAGLRGDGTVLVSAYDEALEAAVAGWTNVVKISAYNELIGLRDDGTVVATDLVIYAWMMGVDEGNMAIDEWTDVVDVYTWGASFIGLRADGTLLTSGANEGSQLDVDHWKKIAAVVIDNYTTFALTDSGILLQSTSEYGASKEVVAFDVRNPEG